MEAFLYRDLEKGLLAERDPSAQPQRTLPCQLMDWADDIAYSMHDLEDGIVGELLQPATWMTDDFLSVLHASVVGAEIRWSDGPPDPEEVRRIVATLLRRIPGHDAPYIPRDVLREMTRYYIDRFATAGTIEASGDGSSSYDFFLAIPEEIRIENQVLKSITFEYVIRDARTTTIMYKGREIVTKLFEALFQRATDAGSERARRASFQLFPREMRKELESFIGRDDALARFVCDYIAGMTEGQAIQLYGRMFEPGAGSPFAWT
jgi:dGTPase